MERAKRLRSTLGSVVLAGAAVAFWAMPVLAASPATGYTGRWTAIDCATWQDEPHEVDCSRWGDASVQTLTIGPGTIPQATYQDGLATVCAESGFPNTRFVAIGTGTYEAGHLFVTYARAGCGIAASGGGFTIDYYYDAGSDTIWEDPDGDGWGLNWVRA